MKLFNRFKPILFVQWKEPQISFEKQLIERKSEYKYHIDCCNRYMKLLGENAICAFLPVQRGSKQEERQRMRDYTLKIAEKYDLVNELLEAKTHKFANN